MKTARYLVTGGAGFIGSHLVDALVEREESVRVLDNLATGREQNLAHLKDRIDFVRADIRDLEAVRPAMSEVEVVFHFAALGSVARSVSDPAGSFEVNVTGTQNVLIAARDAGVRRVVLASSAAVYGDEPTLPKREDLPKQPISPYGVHKLTDEHLCRVFTRLYGLETVALRFFNVFGPRRNPHLEYAAVVPRFLSALLAGKAPTVFGDGEQTRDFTYVANIVQANLLAADSAEAGGLALNIGCGIRASVNDIWRIAAEILGVRVTPQYLPPRAGDVRDNWADVSLATRVLGYTPGVDMREGIRRTLEAMKRDEM